MSCAVNSIRFIQIFSETKYLSSSKDWADWLLLNQKCYEPAKHLTELSNAIPGSPWIWLQYLFLNVKLYVLWTLSHCAKGHWAHVGCHRPMHGQTVAWKPIVHWGIFSAHLSEFMSVYAKTSFLAITTKWVYTYKNNILKHKSELVIKCPVTIKQSNNAINRNLCSF